MHLVLPKTLKGPFVYKKRAYCGISDHLQWYTEDGKPLTSFSPKRNISLVIFRFWGKTYKIMSHYIYVNLKRLTWHSTMTPIFNIISYFLFLKAGLTHEGHLQSSKLTKYSPSGNNEFKASEPLIMWAHDAVLAVLKEPQILQGR